MNILAATAGDNAKGGVYNVAVGDRTSLNTLFASIQENLLELVGSHDKVNPNYRDFRAGDVRHSLADINKAKKLLGYSPEYSVRAGLDKATDWYLNRFLST